MLVKKFDRVKIFQSAPKIAIPQSHTEWPPAFQQDTLPTYALGAYTKESGPSYQTDRQTDRQTDCQTNCQMSELKEIIPSIQTFDSWSDMSCQ